MFKLILAVLTLICVISTTSGIEYSVNVIAAPENFSVEIDCPAEVQEKSRFKVNATIKNLAAENATDVIVELIAPRKFFSYGQPKRVGDIEGNNQVTVSWDVRAKRPGEYNITVIATGNVETTGENLLAQDQETISVKPNENYGLIGIIDAVRSFLRI